jgi:hypothetical protein
MAESQGFGFDDLTWIGEAAAGRMSTLLIEADRKLVVYIHPGSGAVHFTENETEQVEGEDVRDDLGEEVPKMGARLCYRRSADAYHHWRGRDLSLF